MLRGATGRGPKFEVRQEGMTVLSSALLVEGGKEPNLKIWKLFKVMIAGEDYGLPWPSTAGATKVRETTNRIPAHMRGSASARFPLEVDLQLDIRPTLPNMNLQTADPLTFQEK